MSALPTVARVGFLGGLFVGMSVGGAGVGIAVGLAAVADGGMVGAGFVCAGVGT